MKDLFTEIDMQSDPSEMPTDFKENLSRTGMCVSQLPPHYQQIFQYSN